MLVRRHRPDPAPARLALRYSGLQRQRVQQHQIVYQSLKGQMGGLLHALALQTGVPES